LRQHEEALKSAGIPFEAFDVASIDISDRPRRNEEHAEYLTPERHVLPFRDEKPVKMSPGVDGKLVTDRSMDDLSFEPLCLPVLNLSPPDP